jgi:phage shock protein C
MFCTRCGLELPENARYCSQCGEATNPVKEQRAVVWTGGLAIPREGKKIGGVCAGFARYFNVDVTLVRVIWLTAALFAGVGFIAYPVAWLLMPKDPVQPAPNGSLARQGA